MREAIGDDAQNARPGCMDRELVDGGSTGLDRQQLIELAVNETNSAVYVTDDKTNIVFVNRTFTDMLGYQPHDVYGRRARDVLGSQHYTEADYIKLWNDLGRGRVVQQEVRTHARDGREVWLTLSLRAVLKPDGSFANLVGILEDITESRQIQTLQRDVLEAVAQDMPLAGIMNMICERAERMFPEIACSILGVDEQKKLRPLAAPSLPPHFSAAIDGIDIGPKAGSCGTCAWRGEAVTVVDIETDPLWDDFKGLPLPLGLVACWSSPIKLKDGRVAGTFAFYFREKRGPGMWHEQVVEACVQLCMLAFERHEATARIARLAYYDGLTGLPNRTKLREEMEARFDNAESPKAALLFIDIDHFKDVNDTLGHSVGDSFLKELARRIESVIWDIDIISRHGGDEFVIVLDGADEPRASRVAEALLAAIAEPVRVDGVTLPASASIGISLCPKDGTDSATLLRHADMAMYRAKGDGRSTYRFFSAEMNSQAQDRLLLGALLRDAVGNGQIRLAYQPQVDTRTGGVAGVEALARWTHPALGAVPPSRFIPLAEDVGLIETIGAFCIEEACRQLRHWDDTGYAVPHLAVNVSAIQFRNPNLPGIVAAALALNRLGTDRLTLEVTESVMMDALPTAAANAAALREMGITISMDDFGTGYSSLSHLARLPVSELKIDRSFMSDLEESEAVQAMVTAVIRIGETLKMRVVAEGVETVAQRRFLEALGCDVLQGYLFAHPMSPDDFTEWMDTRGALIPPVPDVHLRAS
ncbi:MAG: EAL domain-containing protein [Hyphomicrobiales bacterium]|nr:MAG: EAL domain-containing protein [Hyphomicrobiales bacterium]